MNTFSHTPGLVGWRKRGTGPGLGKEPANPNQTLCLCIHCWPQIPQGSHYLSSGLRYVQCRQQGNI